MALWNSWTSIGSLAATVMVFRSTVDNLIPYELRAVITRIYAYFRPISSVIIEERDRSNNTNPLFEAAQVYLGSHCLSNVPTRCLSVPNRTSRVPVTSLHSSFSVTDVFEGATFQWTLRSTFSEKDNTRIHYLELKFHKRFVEFVDTRYLPFILEEGDKIEASSRIIINEHEESGGNNQLFKASLTYISSCCLSSASTRCLSVQGHDSRVVVPSLPQSHSVTDVFHGVTFNWMFHPRVRSSKEDPWSERRLELTFPSRSVEIVDSSYIPFILDEAKKIKAMSRQRRLYTNRNCRDNWTSVSFDHPSSFDTLAMEPALREEIYSDLRHFTSDREFYTSVGRAWKRGYLLHGPPGTGKSTLIAAIANFLKYEIYDLDLTHVSSNSGLHNLLLSTPPKSILVIEDIDCSIKLSNRSVPIPDSHNDDSHISLSGMLNAIDGLWSSSAGERLIIFTTNHPENLDPALLRSGRMDMKIELSYCGPAVFRQLAHRYLDMEMVKTEEEVTIMDEAESMLMEAKITPADVADVFLTCRRQPPVVGLKKMVDVLITRRNVQEQAQT